MNRQVIKQNVGVDISKADFQTFFYQSVLEKNQVSNRVKGSKKFKNTLAGFTKFLVWIESKRSKDIEVRITMEATGVYYEQLVYFLSDRKEAYHVSVVLPNKSKAYFKSHNEKSKTDKIDAKLLGLMGLERDLDKWQPGCSNMRILKQLTRDRVNLLDQKITISNQLHALKHSYQPSVDVIKRSKQRIKLLTKQIKEVEKQIQQAVKSDIELNERIEKVCQVQGLGLTTVATIVAETGGFELFTSRGQLISYAGYDIVERESGSSIKGKTRISKKGNKHIRRALHFPALVVVKYDPFFRNLFNRVFERTKIKMKAYVAVQRKLLILIYTLFKKNEDYNLGNNSGIEVIHEATKELEKV